MRRGPCAAVWVASFWLCACHADGKTGLFATVRFGGLAIDQIELGGVGPAASAPLVSPTLRPAQPGPALASPQTVVIYLPDALAGTAVTSSATGLAGGLRLDATAAATVTVSRGQLVAVDLALAAGVLKPNGQTCAGDAECTSTLCVDGVCCASTCGGLCQACNVKGMEGSCTPVPAGTASPSCAQQPAASCGFDGTCDGNGGCRRYPSGVACGAGQCTAGSAANALVGTSACDGQGACVTPAAIACAPYLCDAIALRCTTSCVTGTDCASGTCLSGSCGPRQKTANGLGCATGDDCLSTFCQDGVCCDSACTAGCMSCNQPAALGTCTHVPAGKIDPRGVCQDQGITSCGTNGLCGDNGACALYPAGATCAPGACSGGHFVRSTKQCDGNGACLAAPDIDCDPYRCDPTTTACYGSCTSNSQCAMGLNRSCSSTGMCQ